MDSDLSLATTTTIINEKEQQAMEPPPDYQAQEFQAPTINGYQPQQQTNQIPPGPHVIYVNQSPPPSRC